MSFVILIAVAKVLGAIRNDNKPNEVHEMSWYMKAAASVLIVNVLKIVPLTSSLLAKVTFTPLGNLPGGYGSTVWDVSADRSVVVGYSSSSTVGAETFR